MNRIYLWPDEAVEILRKMAAERFSARAILRALPRDANGRYPSSRGSVIGKCRRLGISLEDPAKRASAPKRKRGDAGATTGAAALKTKPGYKPPPEPPPALDMPDGVPTGAEAVMGVSSRACHWPVGDPQSDDFRFCCAPMEIGQSYCPYHKALSVDAARMKRLRGKVTRDFVVRSKTPALKSGQRSRPVI